MKKTKIASILLLSLIFIVSSCTKDKYSSIDLTQNILGTYTGTINNTKSGIVSDVNVDVTKVNDYTVNLDCFGDDIDTSFMLEIYSNGDSLMTCYSGETFKNEYGHMSNSGNHMMDMMGGGTGMMDWTNHLQTDHATGDEHYGYFGENSDSLIYSIKEMVGDSEYFKNLHCAKTN